MEGSHAIANKVWQTPRYSGSLCDAGQSMKFDIYGKFQLQVEREHGRWQVYKLGNGYRTPVHDIVIPSEVSPEDLPGFLDDVFHETSRPGSKVRVL